MQTSRAPAGNVNPQQQQKTTQKNPSLCNSVIKVYEKYIYLYQSCTVDVDVYIRDLRLTNNAHTK